MTIINNNAYSLRYKCRRSPAVIKRWLDNNCDGEYELSVTNQSTSSTVEIVLQFVNESDRLRFSEMALGHSL